jgi:hypothetical protein
MALECLERLGRQPFTGFLEGLFAGQTFQPGDLFFSVISALQGAFNNFSGNGHDLGANTVACNDRDRL